MADKSKPDFAVFTVTERQGGEQSEGWWTRIGSAWANKDGKGFNVVLEALPVNGRLVLRVPKEDADEEPEQKPVRRK